VVPTHSAKGAEWMGHPAAYLLLEKQIPCGNDRKKRHGKSRSFALTHPNDEDGWSLALVGFAEFGDYLEVFEGGGVAFDFAVGG